MERNKAEVIATALEEAILQGDYHDGDRLDEIKIAGEYGVSRTPVREALQKLLLSGLIEQIPRRGVFVRQPGPVELIELFEFMAELESCCGRLAALRISDEGLETLRETNKASRLALAANDTDQYYEYNEIFHSTIYRESGNRILESESLRLHQRLKPYRRIQLQVRGRPAQSLAEHEAIVASFEAGESDKASLLLREHVAVQVEKFRHLLSSLDLTG